MSDFLFCNVRYILSCQCPHRERFIAALKRLDARRFDSHAFDGENVKLYVQYSDNATHFIGAYSHFRVFINKSTQKLPTKVEHYLINDGIIWKIMSARSPNFSSFWRAAVKSY